jgi:hypothetical protein
MEEHHLPTLLVVVIIISTEGSLVNGVPWLSPGDVGQHIPTGTSWSLRTKLLMKVRRW